MPVAINTFVILGGLMNKDNVVATLKQSAIVRRNFTDVCIKNVNDLNYGLVDYVYLQDKKKGIGVRFPVKGVDSDISEEAFIDIVLQACISYAKSESKIRKCSDIRYAVKNHTLRIKLSYKGLAHTIDACMIAGEILDLNVLIQSVISNNDDSMYRSFIPCNELERFGYDVSSIVTTAIQDSIASGFSLKSLVDVLKELEAPIDLRDKSSMYVLRLNDETAYSSTILLCDSILQAVRERLQEDYYVLPSSQYELLVLSKSSASGFDVDYLKSIIHSANCDIVSPKDFLSDSLYYFDGTLQVVE